VLLAGIFSLMTSPDAFDRGKAAATSLSKSAWSQAESATIEHNDCSSDRLRPSEVSPSTE
jgi:hypothetical protein